MIDNKLKYDEGSILHSKKTKVNTHVMVQYLVNTVIYNAVFVHNRIGVALGFLLALLSDIE